MSRVSYNQSGYCGCSMSVNAARANADGEMPKSKWTKAAMLAALNEWLEEEGLTLNDGITPPEKLTKSALFDEYFYNSSWHHTGKYANITEFYALNTELLYDLTHEEN